MKIWHTIIHHSFVDGHLGCFHILGIANSTAISRELNLSFQILVLSGYMSRSGLWHFCIQLMMVLIVKFSKDLKNVGKTTRPLSSVQFSSAVMSDSLWPHGSQYTRPPSPSPTPGVHSNSCPSSRWCHPAISSSVVPFSSCPQSLPASESFPMS